MSFRPAVADALAACFTTPSAAPEVDNAAAVAALRAKYWALRGRGRASYLGSTDELVAAPVVWPL